MNRLVTGLEKENFEIYDNNVGQVIKYLLERGRAGDDRCDLRSERQHVVEVYAGAEGVEEFLRTSNPQDEFFVVGFNDRPAVIVDYTSDVDDVEARMVMLKPENRTALIDAIYLGIDQAEAGEV